MKEEPRLEYQSVESLSDGIMHSMERDRAIRNRDPLGLDDFFVNDFPKLNEAQDTETLLARAKHVASKLIAFLEEKHNEADVYAAHRDFACMLTALGTHGVDIQKHPLLVDAAREVRAVTGESPRDSVFTYMFRNHDGGRMRTFTHNIYERSLVRGFQIGVDSLNQAIHATARLGDMSPSDPLFAGIAEQIVLGLEGMFNGIRKAREIPPDIFMHVLRPYSEPITIDGVQFHGPGGAQAPIYAVDALLWGSDSSGVEWYREYVRHSVANAPYAYKDFVERALHMPSIVTQCEVAHKENPSAEVTRSIRAVRRCLLALRRFRMTHLNLARQTFSLRGPNAIGSSGSPITILEKMNDALEEAIARVDALA